MHVKIMAQFLQILVSTKIALFSAVHQSGVKKGVFNIIEIILAHNCNTSRASFKILYRYLEIGEFMVHT